MKIAVTGYSGSGKSTLARRLGEIYGAKVLHLDTVEFTDNWQKRGLSEKQKLTEDFMTSNESWVIDGNYSGLLYEERMEQADLIIIMLFNRFTCLKRAYLRSRKYKGKTRPDMADGCIEKLDREFVMWILKDGRTSSRKARYKALREKYGSKTVVLKNQRELNEFLRNWKK